MASFFRSVIDSQLWLSRQLDTLLPEALLVDGYEDFEDEFCSKYLLPDQVVYDVGGGKNPFFDLATKKRLNATVVGVDIDGGELARAPEGVYDRVVVADVCTYRGSAEADLVICQTLLEHVPDVGGAIASIASMLKPGGRALVFVPCRNAVFARLNLILPEDIKKKLMFTIFPSMRREHGFKSYYDRCTPGNFIELAGKAGMRVDDERLYYKSDYFKFFFPLYAAWRVWTLKAATMGPDFAETFSMLLVKAPASTGAAS